MEADDINEPVVGFHGHSIPPKPRAWRPEFSGADDPGSFARVIRAGGEFCCALVALIDEDETELNFDLAEIEHARSVLFRGDAEGWVELYVVLTTLQNELNPDVESHRTFDESWLQEAIFRSYVGMLSNEVGPSSRFMNDAAGFDDSFVLSDEDEAGSSGRAASVGHDGAGFDDSFVLSDEDEAGSSGRAASVGHDGAGFDGSFIVSDGDEGGPPSKAVSYGSRPAGDGRPDKRASEVDEKLDRMLKSLDSAKALLAQRESDSGIAQDSSFAKGMEISQARAEAAVEAFRHPRTGPKQDALVSGLVKLANALAVVPTELAERLPFKSDPKLASSIVELHMGPRVEVLLAVEKLLRTLHDTDAAQVVAQFLDKLRRDDWLLDRQSKRQVTLQNLADWDNDAILAAAIGQIAASVFQKSTKVWYGYQSEPGEKRSRADESGLDRIVFSAKAHGPDGDYFILRLPRVSRSQRKRIKVKFPNAGSSAVPVEMVKVVLTAALTRIGWELR